MVSAELEEEHPSHFKLMEKIEDARNSLNAGNIEGAKHIYQQLGMLYANVPEGEDKKRIYYQILELKSDIELAMLR